MTLTFIFATDVIKAVCASLDRLHPTLPEGPSLDRLHPRLPEGIEGPWPMVDFSFFSDLADVAMPLDDNDNATYDICF